MGYPPDFHSRIYIPRGKLVLQVTLLMILMATMDNQTYSEQKHLQPSSTDALKKTDLVLYSGYRVPVSTPISWIHGAHVRFIRCWRVEIQIDEEVPAFEFVADNVYIGRWICW